MKCKQPLVSAVTPVTLSSFAGKSARGVGPVGRSDAAGTAAVLYRVSESQRSVSMSLVERCPLKYDSPNAAG